MSELTQERLKQLLTYVPETGNFTWLVDGSPAGCVDKQSGYVRLKVEQRSYRAHRLAWLYVRGAWPTILDHINRDRADNRIANLREVTASENSQNLTPAIGTRYVAGRPYPWNARIAVQGKRRSLGYYATHEQAATAYQSAKAAAQA